MLASLFALALVQAPVTQAEAPDLAWHFTFEAPDGQFGDQFGRALAIGSERAVVSAWRRDGNLGGADVFRFENGAFVHEAALTPSDGYQGSMCGTSAHIDEAGDVVVLSALGDNEGAPGAGAAYVFRRFGDQWVEEAKLLAPGAATGDGFGSAVAAGRDTIVVGAPGVDVDPSYFNAGTVYVYGYASGQWQLEAQLVLPAGDLDIGDGFGAEISLQGSSFAVGVPAKDNEFGDNSGAVYVYTRGAAGWALESRVTAAGQGPGEAFGLSVALYGDRLLAGSTSDVGVQMGGAVYAFERVAGVWVQREKLTAPTVLDFDFFGESLTLHRGRALISGRVGAAPSSTAVHAFRFGPSGSRLTQSLDLPISSSFVLANNTVALGPCFALVGEALHSNNLGQDPSHVHAFTTCSASAAHEKP